MTLRNVRPCNLCHGTAIIQKAQYVRVGPFSMISGVIVKSGEKVRLGPDYKPAPLPFCLYLYTDILVHSHFLLLLSSHKDERSWY